MGLNDAEEMLEAAKAEVLRLEKQIQTFLDWWNNEAVQYEHPDSATMFTPSDDLQETVDEVFSS